MEAQYIRRHHKHQPMENQCSSALVKHIKAPVDLIVHWKNHLTFPEEARLTPEAKNLICRLLCDAENRMGTQGPDHIRTHPWFKDVPWEKLYEMEAAFRPEVSGELDTRNFIKFDEVDPPAPGRTGSGPLRKITVGSRSSIV